MYTVQIVKNLIKGWKGMVYLTGPPYPVSDEGRAPKDEDDDAF